MTPSNPLINAVPVSRREVSIWTVVVVLAEVFALLGIPVALVLAFTRLRGSAPVARWGLVGLACILLALQVAGTHSGVVTGHGSPGHPVH